MQEGGKWELYIPSELAYGDRGAAGGKIPSGALLHEVTKPFCVILIRFSFVTCSRSVCTIIDRDNKVATQIRYMYSYVYIILHIYIIYVFLFLAQYIYLVAF